MNNVYSNDQNSGVDTQKSHVIKINQGEMGTSLHVHEIYECMWKAGLTRYITIKISTSNSMIYVVSDDTGHISMKTYENTPKNLKKAWTRKRGLIRNFKKRESRWTAPELEFETSKEEFN